MQGTIEVTNPAPMDAELASVSDVVSGGIVAAVDCPSLTVPAGGTLVCSYGPVYLPDGGDRVNVATATLNNNDGGTTDFVGTATVSFRSAVVEELDTEVDVTDGMEGFLGTVRYDEVPVHFTYTRMISADGSSGDLIVVDNEVTLVTNDTSTTSTATATVALFEVRTVTLGYEDLPRDQPNDWDYNDLVVDIEPVLEVSPDHDLLAIEFTIRQQLGAGPTGGLTNFVHTFNVQPYADAFSCDGTYRLETTRNGVATAATGSYQRGDNFVIVPFTATPPDVVKLRIEFDVPVGSGCPFQYSNLDVLGQFHGEWLFFDPWIQPWDTGEEIHLLRPPESEYRILTVPVDWQWPVPDGKHIWDYYPKVKAPDPSKPQEGPIFVPQWWVD